MKSSAAERGLLLEARGITKRKPLIWRPWLLGQNSFHIATRDTAECKSICHGAAGSAALCTFWCCRTPLWTDELCAKLLWAFFQYNSCQGNGNGQIVETLLHDTDRSSIVVPAAHPSLCLTVLQRLCRLQIITVTVTQRPACLPCRNYRLPP